MTASAKPARPAAPSAAPPGARRPPRPANRSARGAWRDWLPDVAAFLGALLCAVLAALLAGSLGGCGGGVGTEGTGGFASSSSATGPITGFGSIIVNGVHYDDSGAQVQDDDAVAQSNSVLALGMTVQITGGAVSTDSSGRQVATASQVRSVRALLGPVSAVSTSAGTLTVLGQAVTVQADTVFDTALGSLSAVHTGQVVEVYGSFDAAAGTVLATRIAAVATAKSYSVRGTVTSLDTASQTFVLGGQTYSYAGLSASDRAALVAGALLKFDVQSSTDSSGRWVAGAQRSGQNSSSSGDRDSAKLEGLIASISSSTRLVVEGTTVDIAGAKVTGTPRIGAKVEVSGALRSGVLVATEVEVSSSSGGSGGGGGGSSTSFEVEGRLTSVDTAAKRFTLASGVRSTRIGYGRSDLVVKGSGCTLASLASCTLKLHVVGVLSADRSVLDATSIEFDN